MYERFREANPDFKSRVEALASIISPDPKSMTVGAMEYGRAYTATELYEAVCDHVGLRREEFPLHPNCMWVYCHRSKRYRGSLDEIGAVVRLKVKRKDTRRGPVYATAYTLTDAGADFGRPLAARSTRVVMKADEMGLRYRSMARIVGSCHTSGKHRRGYAVYKVVKLLAENPEDEFRRKDVMEETKLCEGVVSSTLNSLGEAGAIHYHSPLRDVGGKRVRGLSRYRLTKDMDVYEAAAGCSERNLPYSIKLFEHVKRNPTGIERNKIAEELGIPVGSASKYLYSLRKLGYIEPEMLKWTEKQSIARANDFTMLLWDELFWPIERLSYNLKPFDELYEVLYYYEENPERWRNDMKNQLSIYLSESSHGRRDFVMAIRKTVLEILESEALKGKDGVKLSLIHEEVSKEVGRRISTYCVRNHLNSLMKAGKVVRVGWGRYALI